MSSTTSSLRWAVGVVGQGIGGEPSRRRSTPELCQYFLHPPVTYNPWIDRSWCLCGQKTYPGECVVKIHLACCEGAMTEESAEWRTWKSKQEQA